MSAPTVSICVPMYQGARHIGACIESISRQEGVTTEIVVVDDGSSDGSMEIARAVLGAFPGQEAIVQRNAERQGMVGNWNACLSLCHGDFVKVMGQDDILFPGCLAQQVAALRAHPRAALCATNCSIISKSGKVVFHRKKGWRTGEIPPEAIYQKCINRAVNPLGEPVSVLARREDYLEGGGFDRRLRYFVDVEKSLRMLGDRAAYFIEDPLCGFRVHRGAASFSLQGDAYQEFLEIEKRFCKMASPCKHPRVRRWQALSDSLLRLVFYSIWG